jgi:hypothetical protein
MSPRDSAVATPAPVDPGNGRVRPGARLARLPASKYEMVRTLLGGPRPAGAPRATLLDVGCRDCALKPQVSDFADYTGVDLFQNGDGSVDYVLDVEKGLPFPDRAFDFVVAMDLLEHLDGFHEGMVELARVMRGCLLVVLPNLAHLSARLSFLRTGRFAFTGKYDLPLGPLEDRHRWVTVQPQTDAYMRWFAREAQLKLSIFPTNDGAARQAIGNLARALRVPSALWAWKVVYLLERSHPAPAADGVA